MFATRVGKSSVKFVINNVNLYGIINIYERSERVKVSGWKVFQIIQFIIFAGVSIFLFVRQVDGSGAENTLDVKLISFAVWLGFYLFLLALEYGIRFLCVIRKK